LYHLLYRFLSPACSAPKLVSIYTETEGIIINKALELEQSDLTGTTLGSNYIQEHHHVTWLEKLSIFRNIIMWCSGSGCPEASACEAVDPVLQRCSSEARPRGQGSQMSRSEFPARRRSLACPSGWRGAARCWGEIHLQCSTMLPEVFTPTYKSTRRGGG
jgi:hypothetical protein